MTGRPRLLTMGLAALAASSWQSCSNESTGPGSSAVASVAVTPAVVTIGPTDTLRLIAVAKDAAGTPLTGRTITWSTSDPSRATVSTSGLVTGVAAGSATISATAEGKAGQSAITVKFINIAGVWDFTETLVDQADGFTCSDTGSYVFSQTGSAFEGTSGQVGTCVRGGSSNPNNIDSEPVTDGHVTVSTETMAFSVPSCQYTATLSGDPPTSISGTLSCQIVEFFGTLNFSGTWHAAPGAPVASVTVTPATVLGSETAQLGVALKNAAGARLFGRPVTWSSGDQSIATVSATGIVTGLAAGTTTITATVEGKVGSAPVTVAFVDLPSPIAFQSDRSGNYEIYVMTRGGAPLVRLTNTTAANGQPSWSPDGAKVAFTSDRDGNREIYVMNADGSGQTRLTNNSATDDVPAWSPDGTKIAFASDRDGNSEIYVMNADGTNQIRLTNNAATDYWPAWSPDGAKLAFESDRDGNLEIYVMNADGTNATRLTSNSTEDSSPAWSPGGTRIAFSCDPDGTASLEICVINADGTNLVRLTNNPAPDGSPAWSRDGTKILFTSLRNGNADLFIMNPDGTGVTAITGNPATDLNGDWKP
ncbi:MAG TPA: Ig-like domain-containing protein [Gemmatimonadales bacterium]|nr:Ig-like domain-containing protein [Gemmatimonadales bacterium]